ncbi:hypothetical protein AAC387_Pa12g1265 [Persea americana]
MDKSWIDLSNRMSREYKDGINQFMEFTNGFDNEFISCPCRKCANRCETEGAGGSNPCSSADEEALRYFEILDDAQTELDTGCKDFSKLFFIVELLHLKALNQWFDTSFDMLLQLLHRVLPFGAKLTESYY